MNALELYEPARLKLWTMPDHYMGNVWPGYYSSGVGQSRDSDALERSNFECMLKALGGETDTVMVIRESHWAVGWVEWIAVHQDDGKALHIADKIRVELDDYPVVDEEHYSELEQRDADDLWSVFSVKDRLEHVRKYRDQFDFHDYADLMGCIRGKYFSGYASELLH